MGQAQQFIEKVVDINRVAKVTKGGKKLSFGALVVIGDQQGNVGFGFGKAHEVADAIRKGSHIARRDMFSIPLHRNTIPYKMVCSYGATKVILKPAAEGVGVIASGPIRAVCKVAGIKDIIVKSIGSNNPINVVKAVVKGLKTLSSIEQVRILRSETQSETQEVSSI